MNKNTILLLALIMLSYLLTMYLMGGKIDEQQREIDQLEKIINLN